MPCPNPRRLALALGALSVLWISAPADAQTLNFTDFPATLDTGENGELRLELELPSGVYEDLDVILSYPDTDDFPAANLGSSTANADFAYTTNLVDGVRTVTWSRPGVLDLSTSTSTRQFLYLFSLGTTTLDGTPLTFTAEVTGTRDGAPLNVETATAPVVASRAFDPDLVFVPGWGTGNVRNPESGSRGILRTHAARHAYPGNDRAYPMRFEATMTLPAGVAYVDATSYHGNSGQNPVPVTPVTAAMPWQTLAAPAEVFLAYRDGTPQIDHTASVQVNYFIDCDALAIEPAPELAAVLDAEWEDFGGTVSTRTVAKTSAVSGAQVACGDGGALTNYSAAAAIQSGTQARFPLRLTPPIGVPVLEDAFLAFSYPLDIEGVAHGSWSRYADQWESWSCDFSTVTLSGQNGRPTLVDFLLHVNDHCTTEWLPGDTHGILYAPTLGDTFAGAEFLRSDEITLAYRLPPDWSVQNGSTVNGAFWFTASDPDDEFGGWGDTSDNPSDDRFELALSVQLPTDVVPTFTSGGYSYGGDYLDVNNNFTNAGWRVHLGWNGDSPRNARVAIDIPEGVVITTAWLNFDANDYPECEPLPGAYTVSALGVSPVVLTMGTADVPFTPPGACQNRTTLQFRFEFDPDYPFFHEQPVVFTVTHTAENQTTDDDATTTRTRFVIVAAGQDARLAADCDEDGGTVFTARAINRGRDPIEGGILLFALPPGTAATALTPNADVALTDGVLEVSTNGGSTWAASSGSLAGVTHIRLRSLGIPGGSFGSLPPQPGFTVAIDPLAETGPITGVATMSSPTLGVTDPREATIVPGTCPGTLTLEAYFDLNGDGVHQPGEPTVPSGHVFELTPAPSSATGAGTDPLATDGGGLVTWADVVPGTYDVVYVSSPPSTGTWALTSAFSATMESAGSTTVEVGLSCGCEDPAPTDVCIDALCDLDGNCTETALDEPGPCDEPTVVWVLVTQGGADFGIRCERLADPEPRIVCADELTAPVCAQ